MAQSNQAQVYFSLLKKIITPKTLVNTGQQATQSTFAFLRDSMLFPQRCSLRWQKTRKLRETFWIPEKKALELSSNYDDIQEPCPFFMSKPLEQWSHAVFIHHRCKRIRRVKNNSTPAKESASHTTTSYSIFGHFTIPLLFQIFHYLDLKVIKGTHYFNSISQAGSFRVVHVFLSYS